MRHILMFMKMNLFLLCLFVMPFPLCASPQETVFSYEKPFSINLTWVNNRCDLDQPFIFPCRDEEELKSAYVTPALTWAQMNPDENCTVNIWYDGALLGAHAVQNTRAFVDAQDTTAPHAKIAYRDFRDIPFVRENAHAFEERVPVYFRADLLRLVAALHDLASDLTSCFIFANCNFPPIGTTDLFDPETQELLSLFGHVFSDQGVLGYENSFFMLTKDCPEMITALKRGVVFYNTQRAKSLTMSPYYQRLVFADDPTCDVCQSVFSSYRRAFFYCYALLAKQEIYPVFPEREGTYDWDTHGMRLFDPVRTVWDLRPFTAPHVAHPPKILSQFMDLMSYHTSLRNVFVPKKRVKHPPSKGQWNADKKGNHPSQWQTPRPRAKY